MNVFKIRFLTSELHLVRELSLAKSEGATHVVLKERSLLDGSNNRGVDLLLSLNLLSGGTLCLL